MNRPDETAMMIMERKPRRRDRFKAINVFFWHSDFANEKSREKQDEKPRGKQQGLMPYQYFSTY